MTNCWVRQENGAVDKNDLFLKRERKKVVHSIYKSVVCFVDWKRFNWYVICT